MYTRCTHGVHTVYTRCTHGVRTCLHTYARVHVRNDREIRLVHAATNMVSLDHPYYVVTSAKRKLFGTWTDWNLVIVGIRFHPSVVQSEMTFVLVSHLLVKLTSWNEFPDQKNIRNQKRFHRSMTNTAKVSKDRIYNISVTLSFEVIRRGHACVTSRIG